LEACIIAIIREFLGEGEHDRIALDGVALSDIGFDSLRLMNLMARIDAEYPLDFDRAAAYPRATTVDELIEFCMALAHVSKQSQ
jgi:acyl carrier protein